MPKAQRERRAVVEVPLFGTNLPPPLGYVRYFQKEEMKKGLAGFLHISLACLGPLGV